MSGIIDIARSGVLAYRTALSVTAENIANVNTEGYVRRDVVMRPITGSNMTATSGSTLGHGVAIEDVRRAFDQIAADRLRASDSALAASQTQVSARTALEDAFLPGASGVGEAMEEFFGNLGDLAAQPADIGLRRVVMQQGAAVAGSFADAAASLATIREDIFGVAKLAAERAGSILSDLATLNDRMIGISSSPGAANPLHDMRDKLLADLADAVEVNVDFDGFGRVAVRLGPGPGGQQLLDGSGAAALSANIEAPLSLKVTKAQVTVDSVVLTGGALGGAAVALAAVDSAAQELDNLAQRLVSDMNAAHQAGLDLNGLPGGDLFEMTGTKVVPGPMNRGTAGLVLSGHDLAAPVTLTYDSVAALWRATDAGGTELATGAARIDLPGLSIDVAGAARDGDSFVLTPRSGKAIDMRFAVTDPRTIAAAASTVVAPMAGNAGTASITIEATERPATGQPALPTLLAGTGAADAVTMINPGVVGVIPAGTSSVELFSLARQASLDFTVANADVAAGGTLSFSVGGTAHSFALPPLASVAALAAGLNDGSILSADGRTLAEVGGQAGGLPGQFTVALANGDFDAGATITTGAGTQGAITTAANPQASAIQVFTRDGRQVSGTPLTAAEAALLLTPANGFMAGAQYRPDYLNGADGDGYRGTVIDREVVPGAEALTLSLPGGSPQPAMPLSVLSGGQTVNFTLPEGATAERAADLVRTAFPGLAATAQTNVALSGVSDGQVNFTLAGSNLTPIQISATVVAGDLNALARAVTVTAAATGITASVSPDGTRLLLTNAAGADIRLGSFAHSASGNMEVTPAGTEGQDRAAGTTLGLGTTSARVTGEVILTGAASFGVSLDGVYSGSAPDAFAGGMAQRVMTNGGLTQTLTFSADPDADAGAVAADGLSALAAGLSQTLNVNGKSVTLTGAATPAAVADGLAALLREDAPVASITGAVVGVLPSEGTAMAVKVDGVDYVLRMQSGSVVVEGPETGRLTASFGGDMRLRLEVPGGAPDGMTIVPDTASSGAVAFGLGTAQAATVRLTGLPVVPGDLPPGGQVLSVEVAGVQHDLTVLPAGAGISISVPPGFGGTASVGPSGEVILELAANAGPMRVLPGADSAGFGVPGVAVTSIGGRLGLASVTGEPPVVGLSVDATARERLRLSNLPPEDLIVVMTGGGALKLAGSVTPSNTVTAERATELRITDPQTGRVELLDSLTGQSLSSAFLDAAGQATLGGYRVTMRGNAVAGDGFTLTANTAPNADSRALERMIALAEADPEQGRGGFAKILADMTSSIGAQTKAATQRQDAMKSANDSLSRKLAEAGGVDLDAEAASLIELQQAYQASAQALSVARQLFDTILNAM